MSDSTEFNPDTAKKSELRAALKSALEEMNHLRASLGRTLRQLPPPRPIGLVSRDNDSVPAGWAERNGIEIPRADGVFESATAWVRVAHGVITGAGLRNQSILSMMISLRLVDEGAERSARLYTDWKAAFLSRLDPGTSGGKGTGDPEAWSKEDRYSKLLHRVDHDCLFAMDAIVAEKPKAKHLAAFHGPKQATKEKVDRAQAAFVAAFRVVSGAMAEIDREADKALEELNGQ